MDISAAIIFLGAIVLLSHFFTIFFDKIKIPSVLLLMIIGIIVGPISGLVNIRDFGKIGPVFSNLVLLFILFESGAGLKLKEVRKSILGSSLITLLSFFGTLIIISGFTHFFIGLDWIPALMTGAILGGTSSAIVIPMIRQVKLNEESRSLLLMESALSDVLCLICGLSLFMAMKTGNLSVVEISKEILINFLISLAIGIAAGIAWTFALEKIRKVENSLFITAAYLFIVYGITEYFKFNGGIAALVLGITLGNISSFTGFFNKHFKLHPHPINENEKKFFGEMVFVFATYFFVYIGIAMQFAEIYFYVAAVIIVGLLFLYRFLLVNILVRKPEMKSDRKIIFAVAPKGLVPAILASQPLQAGLKGGMDIQNITFAIIFLTIVTSSVLVIIMQNKREQKNILKPLTNQENENPIQENI